MPQIIEIQKNAYIISTDSAKLDIDAITDMLKRAYWAQGRTREMIARYIQHSLVFGIYHDGKQVGLARIVSDYTTFAWLCDVFIHEDHRGRGLGKWLMETVHAHPDLQGLRRWLLATKDAHGLYQQFGWKLLDNPERWMYKIDG